MAYIKSALAGFGCWFFTSIVYIASLSYILLRRYQPPPGVEVGIDLSSLISRPSYWLIAIAAFALGFYWQFRRG